MKKSKKNRINVVYSTNPDFQFDQDTEGVQETLDPSVQRLYISLDRKNRGGKEVTLIEGFVGDEDDLKTLAKELKSKCGVGGSVKDSEIIIQGNFVEKLYKLLVDKNYQIKKKGGY
ncbi:MAG: translation initiation factor [Crocinitomicaceae bacterium]